MEYNQKHFERLSFWQLLSQKDAKGNTIKIEIPIIQRDYAQGRKEQVRIRENFLNALHDAIKGQQQVELDFIYGSNKNAIFQPLDGQQRLTTLFLLHWYIATKEEKMEVAKERLSRFTYETRISSREFCNDLVTKGVKLDTQKKISENITNTAWFISSWKKDQTISAMLTMLDAIHGKFSDIENCWELLTSDNNPPITFLHVILESFGLSDDLYVKMNARGKQLTSFENFKSRFEKHIKKNAWERDVKNPEDTFEHRIDTIWTDLFWKYKGRDNEIDNKLVNYIAAIAINHYAEKNQSPIPENIRLFLLETQAKYKNSVSLTTDMEKRIDFLRKSPNEVAPEDFPTQESFDYLISSLNKYAKDENDTTKPNTPLWDYCNQTLFADAVLEGGTDKFSFQKQMLFHAQTAYLLQNETFQQDKFDDWMRVVRNIIENISGNLNLYTMVRGIRLISELAKYSKDIYKNMANDCKIDSKLAERQVKQEIEKAKIIMTYPYAKQIIHDTEDTNFCRGNIEFALYCADYDLTNNPDIKNFSSQNLDAIQNVIKIHLNGNDVTNDFRRAFFTIGENDFYDYWQGHLLILDNKEYKSKRCLILNIKDLKENFSDNKTKNSKYRKYLKDIINRLCSQGIDGILSDFINSEKFQSLPVWKQKIIQEQGLLDYCKKHYIAIKADNSECYRLEGEKLRDDANNDVWDKLMKGKI